MRNILFFIALVFGVSFFPSNHGMKGKPTPLQQTFADDQDPYCMESVGGVGAGEVFLYKVADTSFFLLDGARSLVAKHVTMNNACRVIIPFALRTGIDYFFGSHGAHALPVQSYVCLADASTVECIVDALSHKVSSLLTPFQLSKVLLPLISLKCYDMFYKARNTSDEKKVKVIVINPARKGSSPRIKSNKKSRTKLLKKLNKESDSK